MKTGVWKGKLKWGNRTTDHGTVVKSRKQKFKSKIEIRKLKQ